MSWKSHALSDDWQNNAGVGVLIYWRIKDQMPRPLRHCIPGHLHEATLKCFQARYFLVPEDRLNKLIIGALAYAQEKYAMKVCNLACMTNHLHLHTVPMSHEQQRDFFRLANSQISLEAGKRVGWKGGIFKERYSSAIVSEEPEAQRERFKYLMSQGVKEGLVKTPEQWPGAHAAKAWLSGSMTMEGIWIDRTALDQAWREYHAERRRRRTAGKLGKVFKKPLRRPTERQFERKMLLRLTPPPAWSDHSPDELIHEAKEVRAEILAEHAELRQRVRPGWKRRLTDKRNRCHQPESTKRGKRPNFHTASAQQWLIHTKNWELWVTRYEDAASKLKRGVVSALFEFPDDCFLPTGLLPRSALKRLPQPP